MYRRFKLMQQAGSLSAALLLNIPILLVTGIPEVEGKEPPRSVESTSQSTAKREREARKQAQGFPSRRLAGASRNDDATTLVALTSEQMVSFTHQNTPIIYFYVPKSTQLSRFELVLRDAQDRFIAEKTFELESESGIIGIPISQHMGDVELVPNQRYHWYFSMIIDPADRAHDLVVEGQLQWTEAESTLTQALESSSALEKVALYQRANLWTDALAILVPLKIHHPDDPAVTQAWQDVLQSIGLEDFAQIPLVSAQ